MMDSSKKVNRILQASLSRRRACGLLGGFVAAAALPLAGAAWAEEKPEYANKALLEKNPIIEDIVIGAQDAPITMVEYSSATCPHCGNYHIHEWPVIKKDYVDAGKVRYIFREFPLDQVALAAFMLTRCASKGDSEKYIAVLDMVMKTQREWARNPKDGLMKIMRMAGLSDEQFDKCLKDEALAKKIMNSARSGSKDFGVQSTPTFFINGRKIVGRLDIDGFRMILDEELKKAAKEPQKTGQ